MNEFITLTYEEGLELVRKITDEECRIAMEEGFMIWIDKNWPMTDEENEIERMLRPGHKYPNTFDFSEKEIRLALGATSDKSILEIVKERIIKPMLDGYYLDFFVSKYIWLEWDCRNDREGESDEEFESMLRHLALMYLLRELSKDFLPRLSRLYWEHRFGKEDGEFWERARERAERHNARGYVPESFGSLPALSVDGETPSFEESFHPHI